MKEILKKVENLFVILCLIVGFIFIVITPPFQVSDENSHFFKMYSITDGSIYFKRYTMPSGKTYAVSNLPISVISVGKDANEFIYNYDMKYSADKIKSALNIRLNKDKKSLFIYFIPAYGALSYMPGILILEVLKLLDVNPLWMMYILRVVSLLTYILITYWAIRIVPVKKWLFMFAGLLPGAIYGACGVSTDGIVTSLCFLYTAYIFNLAFNNNLKVISQKDFIIISAIILYITICKFPYAILTLLMFIIPKEKFPQKLSQNKTFWITVLSLIIYVLIYNIHFLMISKGLTSPNEKILPVGDTISYAMQNPIAVIKLFISTITASFVKWWAGAIALFGWSDTFIPIYGLFMASLILIFSSFFKDREEVVSDVALFKNKVIYFLISFLFFLFTLIVCYLLFSYKEFDFIRNMQGRYLIPLTPLIYLIFASKISVKYDWLKILSIISFIFLIFMCAVNILNRFY